MGVWLGALFVVVLSACPPPPVKGACEADENCGEFQRCDLQTGLCLCAENRACQQNEFCNDVGRCQPNTGCLVNEDCVVSDDPTLNQFCDIKSGQCKAELGCDPLEGEVCCTLDSHCGFGQICNLIDGRCIPGCRDDGDCLLGQGCVTSGLGAIGQCEAGSCTANNLCGFGEVCDLSTGTCVFDSRGPYCFSCSGGVGSDDCGHPANYCLTDTSDPTGQSEYCGVDCSQNQPCPFGYSCNDVIIVPPSAPFCTITEVCEKSPGSTTGTCTVNTNVICEEDEDCPEGPPGGTCPRAKIGNCLIDQGQECEQDTDCCDDPTACPEGSCVKQECRGGEGDQFGACTCTRDLDCPVDTCKDADLTDPNNPIVGHCELSGHDCYENLDCDVISCIDGGCRIGSNCAPANDRNCRELAP